MAIKASELGADILRAITKGGSVTFDTPYIGLLDASGNRISYPEYANVRIDIDGIKGTPIMGSISSEENGKVAVITSNPEEAIYFPENKTGAAVTATGWGLFPSKTATMPNLWGELKNSITIGTGSVPVIRGGDLILKVK